MPTDVIMPKVDMVMDEGTIVRWLRRENEAVTAGEPLFEIATDKATMEVEAPASGILAAVSAGEGDTVPVATRIALIYAPGESPAATPAAPPTPAAPAAPPPRPAAAPGNGASAVQAGPRPRATPVARRLARQHNMDLASVPGSGPLGRVQKRDVLREAERRAEPVADQAGVEQTAGPATRIAPPPSAPPPDAGQGELLPLTGVRRIIAERLGASASIPQFTLTLDVDMTAALALRERLPFRPSVTAILARAVAPLLLRHPSLNSSFRDDGIWQHASVHLGIAMDSDGRLLVPVIRDAQLRSLPELAAELDSIKRRAAAKQLGPAELQGSTFSISNLGMFGVDQFSALVNPPEAAILAVGRISDRAVGVQGTLVLRPLLTLTLSADHRVTDGAAAARFLAALRAALEEPYLLL